MSARDEAATPRAGGILDVERFRKHWLVSLVIICAGIVGATWTVAVQILVGPRDFEIARRDAEITGLQKQINELKSKPSVAPTTDRAERDTTALSETGVFENNSVTTSDGVCSIQVVKVSGNTVIMSVIIGSDQPQIFRDLRPGERITVQAKEASYFVDIHRIRGDIVDLAVYRKAH